MKKRIPFEPSAASMETPKGPPKSAKVVPTAEAYLLEAANHYRDAFTALTKAISVTGRSRMVETVTRKDVRKMLRKTVSILVRIIRLPPLD